MIKQNWVVKIDDREVTVGYKCSKLSGKIILTVDGDSFVVKGKPFGIGLAHSEMILLGGAQGMLNIGKNGKAELICRDGEVTKI